MDLEFIASSWESMDVLKPCMCMHVATYSVFTLTTSELCQTGLVPFLMAHIRLTGTWQVPVVLLISAFENEQNQSGTVLKLLV